MSQPTPPKDLWPASVAVKITRWLDDRYPGFVECRLVDATSHEHFFHDKVPIFAIEDDLDADSAYPRPGCIRCRFRWLLRTMFVVVGKPDPGSPHVRSRRATASEVYQ